MPVFSFNGGPDSIQAGRSGGMGVEEKRKPQKICDQKLGTGAVKWNG